MGGWSVGLSVVRWYRGTAGGGPKAGAVQFLSPNVHRVFYGEATSRYPKLLDTRCVPTCMQTVPISSPRLPTMKLDALVLLGALVFAIRVVVGRGDVRFGTLATAA